MHRSFRLPLIALLVVGTVSAAYARQTGDLTKTELEQMVRELEAKAPKNPDFKYPIDIVLSDEEVLNAQAYVEPSDKQGEKPQTKVRVFQRFVRFLNGDRRLLRAVLAHEVSHISRGHVGRHFTPNDLSLIHTRQRELDADSCGAALLQATGHDKKDMIDFLEFAEKNLRGRNTWVDESLSDHPSFMARIANIADNPNVSRSLAEFDYGMMFLQNRSFGAAYDAFQRSIEKQPDFVPAYVNAAQAKLQAYYENFLPESLRSTWFMVDFGPALNRPNGFGGKGSDDLAPARAAYREAIQALDQARAKDKDNPRLAELTAIAQVIDPDGDPKNLSAGSASLRAMAAKASDEGDKLRLANNAALGMQRSGRLNDAISALIEAETSTLKGDTFTVNFIVAANLGAYVQPKNLSDKDTPLVAACLTRFLEWSPTTEASYQKVRDNYAAICKEKGLKEQEVKPDKITFCTVLGLSYKGKLINLTSPLEETLTQFGLPMKAFEYDKLFPGLKELVWDSSDLTMIADDKTGVLRVTSYSKEAEIVLHLNRPNGGDLSVKVGDNADELATKMGKADVAPVSLVRAGSVEVWMYFPDYGFGIQVGDDGIVKGLTVTPVRL